VKHKAVCLAFIAIHTAFLLRPCKNRDHSSSEELALKNKADGVRRDAAHIFSTSVTLFHAPRVHLVLFVHGLPCSIGTKLTNAQQHHVPMSYAEFHLHRTTNVEYTDGN